MTYYPDLSPYEYEKSGIGADTVNMGWLDFAHNYPQGIVTEDFIERLWIFCRRQVMTMRGFHICEFCDMPRDKVPMAQRGDEVLNLGFAEIRVSSRGGRVYAAPNLIYHYVVEHHYRPPEEFIQAVMESPLPGSVEYEALIQQHSWE